MKKILAITAPLFFLLLGCATPGTDLNMQGVIGKHFSELVAARGMPDQKMSDGNEGEIWIYLVSRERMAPGQFNTTFNGSAYTSGDLEINRDYFNRTYGTFDSKTQFQGQSATTYTPPHMTGYIAHRAFFIDKNGIVYRYAWRGL